MAELAQGTLLNGFRVRSCEDLPEIDGTAYVLHHEASGARLLYLRNDDENKAFSITFKTPPGNDTGVFHILEHSVLCGSDRFPVKEPFVNLLKTSMQTFLNAMTFPDKTMYPVASTNEQDLLNLMDVYMDAVLHPAIYRRKEIFLQEGWHYELDDGEAEETAGAAPRLSYNGVVYNEMKGALSNAENVLEDALQAALFPDTAYRFESGGTPEGIVTLTYEQFLQEHRRHYRLDNSYIVLYGNMNVRRVLEFLDDRYLAPWAAEHAGAQENDADAEDGPRELTVQQPVVAENVVRAMETAPENACCALGLVVGHASEREKVIAADILLDALAGSNEAPLKAALMKEGLADDVSVYLADSVLQPFAVVQLKGSREGAASRLQDAVRDAMRGILEHGIDAALVEAALSHAEFVMREHDFGVSDGVALSMSALAGWLYDDDDSLACAYIRYEDAFRNLRAQLHTGYFDELAADIFLKCPHRACAEVRPVASDAGTQAEALRLAAAAAAMGEDELAAVPATVQALRDAQERPDAPEELATLPVLHVNDIGEARPWPACRMRDDTPLPCLYHEVGTHGIAYARSYYDISCVSFDELPYLSILTMLLGRLNTARHTAAELDTLVQGKLGNLPFACEVHGNDSSDLGYRPVLAVDASALGNRADELCRLPLEVLHETDFSDTAKIHEILVQKRFAMEQGFANAGHAAARDRVLSYYLPAGAVSDRVFGVGFYRFLKRLLADYDSAAASLPALLGELAERVFTEDGLVVSFAGSEDALQSYFAARQDYIRSAATDAPTADAAGGATGAADAAPLWTLGACAPRVRVLQAPVPVKRNEAFIIPSEVSYTALGFDRRLIPSCPAGYDAAWQIASRILSYDFLWNEVRVKGGAYGVGFATTQKGTMQYYSYRDPHIDETLARFVRSADWLAAFRPDDDELEGYIVSSVAGIDAPVKPRALMRHQDTDFLCGRDGSWRQQARADMLAATPEKLRSFAPTLRAVAQEDMRCCFGGKAIIDAAAAEFEVVDLLNE